MLLTAKGKPEKVKKIPIRGITAKQKIKLGVRGAAKPERIKKLK